MTNGAEPALSEDSLHAKRLELSDDSVERVFYARGWTDGLPIVAPTVERVLRVLEGTDRAPGEVIGPVPPRFGQATVEGVAINATLAGCGAEHLPVILAAVEAMLHERFNLYGIQTTTHVSAPLLVLNGPLAGELDVASGYNCFGQGHRGNALIGRAVRLILTNIGGATPGKLDRATFGTPAKYSYCVAENEAESPWEPLHVERGFEPTASTVTVIGAEAPYNVNDHGSVSAEGLLITLAESMANPGINNAYLHEGEPLVVLSPEHAACLARDGLSKDDVKRFLFERARISLGRFSRENVERRILPFWTGDLGEQVRRWLDDPREDVRVPITERWENLMLVVAGGAGKHSLFIPTFGPTKSVTVRIDARPR